MKNNKIHFILEFVCRLVFFYLFFLKAVYYWLTINELILYHHILKRNLFVFKTEFYYPLYCFFFQLNILN